VNNASVTIPDDVNLERDVVFNADDSRPLTLHLLRSQTASTKPQPVIVYIFGGAFRMGSKDSGIAALIPFVQRGYVCVSIEYRYSSEALFPAQLEDVKCAIRFLRANAERFGVDPERIGVFGHSSGGYLSTMLGVTGDRPEFEGAGGISGSWEGVSSRVQAVCDFFGPTDFLAMNCAGSVQDHDSPDSPESELLGGPIQDHPDLAARANPITYITPESVPPPFLIIHGEADPLVPFNQSELLYAALERVNAPVKFFRRIAQAGHGGPAFETPEILGLMNLFFALHLRSEKS
jgi:acetyl esterase/lipase